MNKKDNKFNSFIDGMSFIDDDIIESAINSKKSKKIIPWKKIISLSACFAVVAIGVFSWMKFSVLKDESPNVKGEAGELASETINENNDKNDYYDSSKGDSFLENEDGNYDNEAGDIPEQNVSTDNNIKEEVEEATPPEATDTISPLDKEVQIDDLNKLAYYTGWTILRKSGNSTKLLLSNGKESGIKLLAKENATVGFDTSEIEDKPWETSEEYSGLIPIDPDFDGEVVAYAVYKLTVNSVKYFKINIENDCFLAEQIGKGNTEVMILGIEIENVGADTLIVFKNGEHYFSAFLDDFSESNKSQIYRFSASKYISNFSIVKMPELSAFTFTVEFIKENDSISKIFFESYENDETVINKNVSLDSFSYAENVTVSNTAFGLTEELYEIYIKDVMAGIKSPILPDAPKLPESSEKHIVESCLNSCYRGNGNFETETGYLLISKENNQKSLAKQLFPNESFAEILDSFPEEISLAVLWVKGKAIHSYSEYIVSSNGYTVKLEYVCFADSDEYTVFLFELYSDMLEAVKFEKVEYSTSLLASFTTENEYDYLSDHGVENEDEYLLNLYADGTYRLYKGDYLVFSAEYKVSEGFVCLNVINDTLYLELSNVATFVFKIDGWNRIFKLI